MTEKNLRNWPKKLSKKMSLHHENNIELQKREAVGVIRASRFVRKYVHSHRPITIDTIGELHKEIFRDAWPEVAGKYRMENLEISDSKHLPPHFSLVPGLMKELDRELSDKLDKLPKIEGIMLDDGEDLEEIGKAIEQIVFLAAWLHHKITFIHPFREGNGRTARLAGNLVLERFGLTGISIKIEKENKTRYRKALAQIDQEEDYEPLTELINEGLTERYGGLAMKYYEIKRSKE